MWHESATRQQSRNTPAHPTFRNKRCGTPCPYRRRARSEEHTSELKSLMRLSYPVFCLKKKTIPASKINYATDHHEIDTEIQQTKPLVIKVLKTEEETTEIKIIIKS